MIEVDPTLPDYSVGWRAASLPSVQMVGQSMVATTGTWSLSRVATYSSYVPTVTDASGHFDGRKIRSMRIRPGAVHP